MIGLGLRLAVSGGREAVVRLVIVAVAVGLGVGLLLTALSATSAVKVQNARHAWLWTGTASVAAGHAPAGTDPLWWGISGDEFGGQQIVRVDVAATGPTSPVPPGIPRDPAPGQYYASPALASLLRGTPADELADRYPGRLAGPIGDAALPSPDSLVHHRRAHRRADGPHPRHHRGDRDRHRAAGLRGRAKPQGAEHHPASAGRRGRRRRPHPVGGGPGPADPAADLHRHRDPAVGGPP